MVSRIVVFFLPIGMVALGISMSLIGGGIMLGDAPTDAPVDMSMQTLLDARVAELPQWISVKDARPDWSNSTTVTLERRVSGETVAYQSQIIPLKGDGVASIAYVVHYDWQDFKNRFAAFADTIEAGGEIDVSTLPDMPLGTLTFTPKDASSKYMFGVEREVVADLLDIGFEDVVVIEPGSRPPTTADAVFFALSGIGCLISGILWIRLRRRRCKRQISKSAGFQAGLEKAIRLGVSEGVEDAFASLRDRQTTS